MLEKAIYVLKMIEEKGFKAYIVGGFVRDYILGIESNDIDITTNATPKQLKEIFKNTLLLNDDYGSITVMKKNVRFEITTFRKEFKYIDNRRPEKVEYIDNLEDDLKRRDFTINTICMDSNGEVIDYLNGRRDLDKKVIKTVGNASDRFEEDCLRILRAVRFATNLNFKLSDEVVNAILEKKSLLKKLSYQRKKEELDKIFTSDRAMDGIKLLIDLGLDKVLELKNLNKVKCTDSLIGVWAVLDVLDIYPFSNHEKEMIEDVQKTLELNNKDPYILYKYGLYINSVSGLIKGIPKKEIASTYVELPITKRSDIEVSSEEIMEELNKEPGPYLKDIYKAIEKEILYNNLDNKKEDILNFCKENFS